MLIFSTCFRQHFTKCCNIFRKCWKTFHLFQHFTEMLILFENVGQHSISSNIFQKCSNFLQKCWFFFNMFLLTFCKNVGLFLSSTYSPTPDRHAQLTARPPSPPVRSISARGVGAAAAAMELGEARSSGRRRARMRGGTAWPARSRRSTGPWRRSLGDRLWARGDAGDGDARAPGSDGGGEGAHERWWGLG
jgi:hypothetical protein